MQFYRIRNWETFQHYKDRNPPWVKLHRELLTSETWVSGNDASRVLAIACMLIAAATDNRIPAKPDYIQRVAYLSAPPDFEPLIENGFLEVLIEQEVTERASKTLADASKQLEVARPETEAEAETEKKKKPAASRRRPQKTSLPEDFEVSESVRDWAQEKGYRNLDEHMDAFKRKAKMKGYEYVDWDMAFMEAVRENWAKLGTASVGDNRPRLVL